MKLMIVILARWKHEYIGAISKNIQKKRKNKAKRNIKLALLFTFTCTVVRLEIGFSGRKLR